MTNRVRTEEDKVCQSPLVVTLGGKPYEIKPLVIKDSREWRRKFTSAMGGVPGVLSTSTDAPDEFRASLELMFNTMPDTACELFFDWARDLDRDEIESIASDQEIADAFKVVVSMAFPLVTAMIKSTTDKLSQ